MLADKKEKTRSMRLPSLCTAYPKLILQRPSRSLVSPLLQGFLQEPSLPANHPASSFPTRSRIVKPLCTVQAGPSIWNLSYSIPYHWLPTYSWNPSPSDSSAMRISVITRSGLDCYPSFPQSTLSSITECMWLFPLLSLAVEEQWVAVEWLGTGS